MNALDLIAGPAARPVLVLDDSKDSREMLVEYLSYRGFQVLEASDGEIALTLARSYSPALILMDLQMKGTDVREATRQLKADPATKDIIVIALTAEALDPDERVARQTEWDGFIAKPYDIRALGDIVAKVLRCGHSGLATIDAVKQPLDRRRKRRTGPT